MVEFGAKLSLKDNMYATLKKNLKMQQDFSKQIKDTAKSIQGLGKRVAKPVIQLKDKASPVLNKMKNTLKIVGKTVAKPFIAIKDGATKVLEKVKSGLKHIGSTTAKAMVAIKDGASAGLKKIGDTLKSLAKGATIAVGVAGAGVTALAGGAINEGAKLQQSVGGVETLYGNDAGAVIANANKAYLTAGLSANDYMETVTGFSASLLQSLGGDTQKASKMADRAIIDMADNANKFGTDISSIQTTYQGFAKQNYTMLDNLKLGYGGTKEEMARLIKEASAMTSVQKELGVTVDANSMSFDNIVNAISVVQKNMGVMGATANEAGTTFTGSFNAMKSAFSNVLGGLALGGDITGSMEALVESASTFLFTNFIPLIANVFATLPSAIKSGISKALPKIKENGGEVVKGLKAGIIGLLPSSMQGVATNLLGSLGKVFNSVTGMLSSVAPKIAEKLGGVFGDGGGILDGITNAISMAMPMVESLLLGVADVIANVSPILGSLGSMFMAVLPVVTQTIQTFVGIIQQVLPVVSTIFTSVASVVMPIISAIAGLIQSAMPIISNVISIVVGAIQSVLPTFISIFESIGGKVQDIVGVVQKHMPLFKGMFETGAKVLGTSIKIIVDILKGLWDFLSPVVDMIIGALDFLLGGFEKVFPVIQTIVESVWGVLEQIFSWISDGLSGLGNVVGGIADFWTGAFDAVGNFFGFAYGKDRVPYNNYPAVLHEGEKVLTRNQADQYDRQMSTRGVQVSQTAFKSQPTTNSGGGTNVHIDKLADTVIIEKEADVDKVVEDMVTKFKKLVPNMP